MGEATLLPPAELSARVGGSEADYHQIGAGHVELIRTMLPDDWSWRGRRVLDFGCGTGRTMIQFGPAAAEAELWGCDIDVPSIEWAKQNLSPPLHFVANDELPPIDLPAESFELVYGVSVFTHLVENWSAWLIEMHRLLSVGGLALFSFLGEGMIRDLVGRDWDENRVGMIGLDVGRPWAFGGPNALHSEWWLRKHWGRAFEIVTVRPYTAPENRSGHGWILLRKDDRPAPSREELERLDRDNPREIASLELNLELLKERTASLWAQAGQHTMLYEQSRRSVAARLRAAARALR